MAEIVQGVNRMRLFWAKNEGVRVEWAVALQNLLGRALNPFFKWAAQS